MALAQELHFKAAESLEVLGFQAYFDKPWQLLRFHQSHWLGHGAHFLLRPRCLACFVESLCCLSDLA